jgi:hypothetical protein
LEWNGQRVVYFGRISGSFDLNRVHKAGAKFDPEKTMVQSPTFDQTKRRRFGAYLRSIVAKRITVPENVLIKLFPNQGKSSFCI